MKMENIPKLYNMNTPEKPLDKAKTLDTSVRSCSGKQNANVVVYGICGKTSHSMLSDNPHSGFYEAKTTRTLDRNASNPSCNQGGNVVVYALEGNGSRPSHRGGRIL